MVVNRGEGVWEEHKEGKGGQIYGDGGRLDFGRWAHNAIYNYVLRVAHLKLL